MEKVVILCLFVLLTAGCKEKKKSDIIIVRKAEPSKPTAPVRMQESSDKRAFDWLGATYHYDIERVPDDSLTMVKDETGQQYVDNIITLVITRDDGSIFLSRTFTKSSFYQQLDNDFRRSGILEGLVFDTVEGGEVKFAASVCHPGTDEYIPLVITVDGRGEMNIKRDTQLDIGGEEDEISGE